MFFAAALTVGLVIYLFSTDTKPKFPTGGRPKPKADSSLVRVAGEGEPPPPQMSPDGTGVRDYIHVVDLALGHVRAMERLDTMTCEAINLGTGRGTSVLELVHAFERVNGVRVPFVMKDRRAGDVASCFADPSLALQRLGWKTERSVDDMCRDAWRWQQFAVTQGL